VGIAVLLGWPKGVGGSLVKISWQKIRRERTSIGVFYKTSVVAHFRQTVTMGGGGSIARSCEVLPLGGEELGERGEIGEKEGTRD